MVVILVCHLSALLYMMFLGAAVSKTGGWAAGGSSLHPPLMHGLMLPSSRSAAPLPTIHDDTLPATHAFVESVAWYMCTQKRLCAQHEDGCLGYPTTDGTHSAAAGSLNATFPRLFGGLEHALTSLVVSESAMLVLGIMCTHATLSAY